jgi:ABC-2 type transport system ATP-binding protein
MIDCKNVTKRFDQVVAVDNVTFQIHSGICALVGPNGAGKSTLLKVLTGQFQPNVGHVHIAGFSIANQPLEAKRVMGVVPEDLGLFNSLTVREHLELIGPVYGLSKRETQERANSLLNVLGLRDASNVFLDQCSHGMRKKTALAMAMLPNPRVLFLDEPFEGIDPVAARRIQELLLTISKRGITVFFSSHMLSMVDRLATEVLMIHS